MKTRTVTRTLVLVALMLNLGVAGVYAQQKHVKMTFSGTTVASTINLQPNTVTDDQDLGARLSNRRDGHVTWRCAPTLSVRALGDGRVEVLCATEPEERIARSVTHRGDTA